MSKTNENSIAQLIQRNSQLAKLRRQSQRNKQILQQLALVLPPYLTAQIKTVNLTNAVLAILVTNPAIATKLKQQTSTILNYFSNTDIKLSHLVVRVIP